MKIDQLRQEIAIELDALEQTVDELRDLARDVAGKEPTVREKTAAAAFLAQFYNLGSYGGGYHPHTRCICRPQNFAPILPGKPWSDWQLTIGFGMLV